MAEFRWSLIPVAALSVAAGSAYAVQYMTIEQARASLFPAGADFEPQELLLTEDQRNAVRKSAGVRVRDAQVRYWTVRDSQGAALGRVFIDEVTGKNDLITYALAVTADGKVKGLEILDYRETHGGEVRNPHWRAQFTGKTVRDPLKVDQDIANISGATLSCNHVTDGVRRLMAVNELMAGPEPPARR